MNEPIYEVGDMVYLISHHNDEPDYEGIVSKVTECTTHLYYEVDYYDHQNRSMRCGCVAKHIRGLIPRIEKDITPLQALIDQKTEA